MKTFGEKVISFNRQLHFAGELPEGIRMMNPFRQNKEIPAVSEAFYRKYYNDLETRCLILGINPGRFGGGLTGIPFTDPKRLIEKCGIPFNGAAAHEPSSAFVYEMIDAFGGPEPFYSAFYIHSVCPLGFTRSEKKGREVNYNYYDSPELTRSVLPFIIGNIRKQLKFGVRTDTCFCFGTGKNEKFLGRLNEEFGFFEEIVALEHPRFIMQYKSKSKSFYIEKYLAAFDKVMHGPGKRMD